VAPLIRNGFGVLQIDSRSCADPSSPVSLGANEIKDTAAGLDFLLSRPEVNPDHIAIYGFSMGAVTAIRTAARHPQIAALVAEGGYANLGQHFTRSETSQNVIIRIFRITLLGVYWIRTGINPWSISPVDDFPTISPRPVLLIYGENEIEAGNGWAQYNAARQPKDIWVVPDGVHGRNHMVDPDGYELKIVEFFQRILGDQITQ
jgi:dipeptidyl aminopeptidase/acylaminoacyl peptidase